MKTDKEVLSLTENKASSIDAGSMAQPKKEQAHSAGVSSNPFEYMNPKLLNNLALKRDALEKIHVSAYAVGHLSNDLCAAAWFTYVLYYLQDVVKLGQTNSGFAMLSGQIADGITTPIVGLFSDKCRTSIGS